MEQRDSIITCILKNHDNFLKVEKGNTIMVWLIQLHRNIFKGKSMKVTTNVITSSSYIIHGLCAFVFFGRLYKKMKFLNIIIAKTAKCKYLMLYVYI